MVAPLALLLVLSGAAGAASARKSATPPPSTVDSEQEAPTAPPAPPDPAEPATEPELHPVMSNPSTFGTALGDSAPLPLYSPLSSPPPAAAKAAYGRRQAQADRLTDIGQVYVKADDYDKAADFTRRALAKHRKLGNALGEASALNNLGLIDTYRGRYAEAVGSLSRALELEQGARAWPAAGATLGNMGLAYQGLEDYPKAIDCFTRALSNARRRRDKTATMTALRQLSGAQERTGDYANALEGLKRAVELAKETGDRRAEAAATADLGIVYRDLGDCERAMLDYRRAEKLDRDLGERRGLALALNNIAALQTDLGNYAEARETYAEAIKLMKDIGAPVRTLELNLGEASLFAGDAQDALKIFQRYKDPLYLGKHAWFTRDPKTARKEFARAARSAEKVRNADRLVSSNIGLGLSLEKLGKGKGAREAFENAIAAMERQRELLPPAARAGFLTAKAEGFARTEAYEGRARAAADAADGFRWSEATKARLFVESLSARLKSGASEIPPETARAEAELNARIAALYKQLDLAFRQGDRKAYRELETRLKSAKDEQEAFVERLRREQPAYAAVEYPKPIEAAAVALRDGEALLEYEVTGSKTLAFILRKGKPAEWVSVPADREGIDKLVRSFRKPFEEPLDDFGRFAPKFDASAGAKLHALLIQPLEAKLEPGTKLVIVPDEALGALPFEALVSSPPAAGGKARYLADDHDVAYAQSATALTVTRNLRKEPAARGGLLVLADPIFGDADPRLKRGKASKKAAKAAKLAAPETEAAVKRMGLEGESFPRLQETGRLGLAIKRQFGKLSKVLLGARASQASLREEDLSRYGGLIFATHGILDTDVPYIREPALVLSQLDRGEKRGGFLTMSDVMGLKLNAEVVALTACKTGLGKQVRGEGVMGLGRAFQYAGARNVLVSLWSVAEKSSTMLTESFFLHLREGRSPREALRAARAQVRAAGYDRPFYWASFTLIGE